MRGASFFDISQLKRTSDDSMLSSHMHSFYEMYYLKSGKCELMINEHIYEMLENTLILIPKNAVHKTTYPDDCESVRIGILFTEDYISDIISAIGIHRLNSELFLKFISFPEEHKELSDLLLNQLLKENMHPDKYSQCVIKGAFQQLLTILLRRGVVTNIEARLDNSIFLNSDKSIQIAATYINDNYMNSVTLSSMAEYLHLNPSYFSKKFKTTSGYGFKEYLNKIRITQAEKLLLETDWPMTKIAYECGFETSNYFGDAFKKIRGVSPSVFRKSNGQI